MRLFQSALLLSTDKYDMPPITTFDNTIEALLDLLRSIKDGKTQLPDFQRSWVWNDEQILNAADEFNLREDWAKREKKLKNQAVLRDVENTEFLQAVTLVAIFAAIGDRNIVDPVRAKLARWYWCGVFGELYSSAIESRLAKDLPQVLHWIDGDSEPDTIKDANFASNRLNRLYSRRSAAYKGLSALLLRDKGVDFLTGYEIDTAMYFDDSIDIHHIFPRHWCEKNGIKADFYDSVVNKTPLSSKTNKILGGNAPSIYLSKLQTSAAITEERMNEILRSHVIDAAALRSDNFEAFFQARQKALLWRIEKAMGKSLITDAESVESENIELFDFDEADN